MGCRDGSHSTSFDLEVIFAIENKVVQDKYECQKCCDDFCGNSFICSFIKCSFSCCYCLLTYGYLYKAILDP